MERFEDKIVKRAFQIMVFALLAETLFFRIAFASWIPGNVRYGFFRYGSAIASVFLLFYLLRAPKTRIGPWIRHYWPVVLFFALRWYMYFSGGRDRGTLESILTELFYLAVLSHPYIADKDFRRKLLKFFLFFETVLLVLNFLISALFPMLPLSFKVFFYERSFYLTDPSVPLWPNSNGCGMLYGFAAVLGICLLISAKTRRAKMAAGLYALAHFVSLFFMKNVCRSAIAGIVVSLIFLLLRKAKSDWNAKKSIRPVLLLCVFFLVSMTGSMEYSEQKAHFTSNAIEKYVKKISASRYLIWKTYYVAIREKPLLGYGNEGLCYRRHMEIIEESKEAPDYSSIQGIKTRNTHSSYFHLLASSGILGLFCVLAVFWINAKNRCLERKSVYLAVLYVLTMLLFETAWMGQVYLPAMAAFILINAGEETVPQSARDGSLEPPNMV